jgi:organic hydroperoxide reductase OsmC/OhrA
MMGTLASLLAKKGLPTDENHFRASVEGDIEDVNGVLKITEIRVHYDMAVPSGKRAEAQQAFEQYLPYCPGAQSVIGCIQIKHTAEMKEQRSPS